MKSIFNRIPLVLTAVFVLLAAVRPNVALAQSAEKPSAELYCSLMQLR